MKKRQIWNLWSNIFLLCLEIAGLILLFVLPINIWDHEVYYGWRVFQFYTTDSNLLLLIATTLCIIYQLLLYKKKINKIPEATIFFKLISTACTTLTMMSVLVFIPFADVFNFGPRANLFLNSNLFYHLLCPLTGVVIFLLFENQSNIKLKLLPISIIPTVIYSIFYLSISLTHVLPNGTIPEEYDWYGLSVLGIQFAAIPVILAIGFTFLFAWCLWIGNKKINVFKNKN